MDVFAQILEDYNATRHCVDKGSICHAPDSSMYFGRDGLVSACCYSRSNSMGRYPDNSVAEIWKSAQANSMRLALRRNEFPDGCGLCVDQFTARNFSGLLANQFDCNARPPLAPERFSKVREFLRPGRIARYPVRLEFELSNKCNLECTMCSGFYSSSIRANRENLPPLPQMYGKEFVHQLIPFLPRLTQAKFLGGEPFLVDIYYQIWERLIELNPECNVSITTNGTVFTEKVRRVLEKLNCQIVVSLDSVNRATYESIRRNASLKVTLNNLEAFTAINRLKGKGLTIAICPMVSNWREIPEIISFASQRGIRIFLNTVVFPAAHSLKALPLKERREVLEVYRAFKPELRDEIERANRETLESFCRQIDYWVIEKRPVRSLEARCLELLARPGISGSVTALLSDLAGKTGGDNAQMVPQIQAADPVRDLCGYFEAVWSTGVVLQSDGLLPRLNFDRNELATCLAYLDSRMGPEEARRILTEIRRFSREMLEFAGSITGVKLIEMIEQHLAARSTS